MQKVWLKPLKEIVTIHLKKRLIHEMKKTNKENVKQYSFWSKCNCELLVEKEQMAAYNDDIIKCETLFGV